MRHGRPRFRIGKPHPLQQKPHPIGEIYAGRYPLGALLILSQTTSGLMVDAAERSRSGGEVIDRHSERVDIACFCRMEVLAQRVGELGCCIAMREPRLRRRLGSRDQVMHATEPEIRQYGVPLGVNGDVVLREYASLRQDSNSYHH